MKPFPQIGNPDALEFVTADHERVRAVKAMNGALERELAEERYFDYYVERGRVVRSVLGHGWSVPFIVQVKP